MVRTISDAQSALTPVFDRYGISRAVLFGSVAKGTATQKSDLDILVDSKLRGLKFVGFMEAVRQAVGMPVEVCAGSWDACGCVRRVSHRTWFAD